ncbi:MAG: hypothetical protein GY710_17300 [Desulfobacteraceae bacterium]|nr:hypothetical protein [Desulfobacteraceae bacterium]
MMKTIPIDNRNIPVRPLTRGEIKELKEYGFTIFGCAPTLETADESVEKVFNFVLHEDDIKYLDTLPNRNSVAVWKEIIKETYGAEEEEKNSQGTSDGTSTEKG